MSSVTPRSVGTAMSNRWVRYLRMMRRRVGTAPAPGLRQRDAAGLPGAAASAIASPARPARALSVQPERVHAPQLGEDAQLAGVSLHVVPPHRQVVSEADEVERRRLVQQRDPLREQLLPLGPVGLAVDLLEQFVELRVSVPREVQ